MSSLALPPRATEADVVGNLTMARGRARLPVKMRLGTRTFDAPSVAEAVMSPECPTTMPEERMQPAEEEEPLRTPAQADPEIRDDPLAAEACQQILALMSADRSHLPPHGHIDARGEIELAEF